MSCILKSVIVTKKKMKSLREKCLISFRPISERANYRRFGQRYCRFVFSTRNIPKSWQGSSGQLYLKTWSSILFHSEVKTLLRYKLQPHSFNTSFGNVLTESFSIVILKVFESPKIFCKKSRWHFLKRILSVTSYKYHKA